MGSRIYTRTGDGGTTGLYGGGRVAKTDPRIHAVGVVDELNAQIGLALAFMDPDGTVARQLASLQPDLFAIGSHLVSSPADGRRPPMPDLPDGRVEQMEQWIDEADAALPPLRRFIMPGGSPAGAALHVARTICRRAERAVLEPTAGGATGSHIQIYINRLSDLLFAWARLINDENGSSEIQWRPATRPSSAGSGTAHSRQASDGCGICGAPAEANV